MHSRYNVCHTAPGSAVWVAAPTGAGRQRRSPGPGRGCGTTNGCHRRPTVLGYTWWRGGLKGDCGGWGGGVARLGNGPGVCRWTSRGMWISCMGVPAAMRGVVCTATNAWLGTGNIMHDVTGRLGLLQVGGLPAQHGVQSSLGHDGGDRKNTKRRCEFGLGGGRPGAPGAVACVAANSCVRMCCGLQSAQEVKVDVNVNGVGWDASPQGKRKPLHCGYKASSSA
jgi:hypothetical protein